MYCRRGLIRLAKAKPDAGSCWPEWYEGGRGARFATGRAVFRVNRRGATHRVARSCVLGFRLQRLRLLPGRNNHGRHPSDRHKV